MTFEFSDEPKLEKNRITYVGTASRSFKSRLTSDYIIKLKPNIKRLWVKYHFLGKKVRKKFVKFRSSEEFMVSTDCIF